VISRRVGYSSDDRECDRLSNGLLNPLLKTLHNLGVVYGSVTPRRPIAASVGAKTGTAIYSGMAGVSCIKNGGISNPMGMPVCKLAYSMWLLRHGSRFGKRRVIAIKNSSTAIASAIGHWPISLL